MSTKITAVRRQALDARNKEADNLIFTPDLGELSIQEIELVFALVRGETLSRYAARKKNKPPGGGPAA